MRIAKAIGEPLTLEVPHGVTAGFAPFPTHEMDPEIEPDPLTDDVMSIVAADAGAAQISPTTTPAASSAALRADDSKILSIFPLLPDISATPTLARACAERYPQFVQVSRGRARKRPRAGTA